MSNRPPSPPNGNAAEGADRKSPKTEGPRGEPVRNADTTSLVDDERWRRVRADVGAELVHMQLALLPALRREGEIVVQDDEKVLASGAPKRYTPMASNNPGFSAGTHGYPLVEVVVANFARDHSIGQSGSAWVAPSPDGHWILCIAEGARKQVDGYRPAPPTRSTMWPTRSSSCGATSCGTPSAGGGAPSGTRRTF